ncbi:UNVERIFIED_CONTAM: hypothetical protein GTU68_045575, partial [Idotea baltica]|nr:hypothetical protein [Idotea baltica]
MFCAGADISIIKSIKSEKDGEDLAKQGQEAFDLLESINCKKVAAISGPCVGGGCELVLACDVRIISDHPSSMIGLPEVKLGILPGFGGTQRLPRLIGIRKALDIILAGKVVRSEQALKYGLVNQVVSYDQLLEKAVKIASGQQSYNAVSPSFVDKLIHYVCPVRNFIKKKSLDILNRKTKGFYPAPIAALESVFYGLEKGIKKGLDYEAKGIGKLIVTPESKALIKTFFLTESSKSIGKSAKDKVKTFNGLVIGAGTMGAGIAGVMVKNDCSVLLKDTKQESLDRGYKQIEKYINKIKYLDQTKKSVILNRVEKVLTDSNNIGTSNIVIEAIFENLDLKKRVLGDISKLVPQDCIIASNTSSLSITDIAESIENPERVIGMHFFNPVEKMPLVEIIVGDKTSDKTIAIVAALSTKLGKFPIVVRDVPGFLINRSLSPYLSEAAHL